MRLQDSASTTSHGDLGGDIVDYIHLLRHRTRVQLTIYLYLARGRKFTTFCTVEPANGPCGKSQSRVSPADSSVHPSEPVHDKLPSSADIFNDICLKLCEGSARRIEIDEELTS